MNPVQLVQSRPGLNAKMLKNKFLANEIAKLPYINLDFV